METTDIKITKEQFHCLNDEDCFGLFHDERNKAHDTFFELKSSGMLHEDEGEYFHPEVWTNETINLLFDSYKTIFIKRDDTLWAYDGNNETFVGKAQAEGLYDEAKKLLKK